MSILGYHPPSFISLKPSSSTWDLWETGPWDCTPQAYSCSLTGDNGHPCPSVQRVLEVQEFRECPADLKDLVVPSYHNQEDQEHLRGMEGMRKKLQYDRRIKLGKWPPFLKTDLEHPEGHCLPSLLHPYLLSLPLHQEYLGTHMKASMWKTGQMEHWTAVGNISSSYHVDPWVPAFLHGRSAQGGPASPGDLGCLDFHLSLGVLVGQGMKPSPQASAFVTCSSPCALREQINFENHPKTLSLWNKPSKNKVFSAFFSIQICLVTKVLSPSKIFMTCCLMKDFKSS